MRIDAVSFHKHAKDDYSFYIDSEEGESIPDWITQELQQFGTKPVPSAPSPSKYPAALRLVGGNNYWQRGMVWVVFYNKTIKIVFVQEKPVFRMSAIEHQDYQENLDVRNNIIHHFMQIALKKGTPA